jgi:hypothetical protein
VIYFAEVYNNRYANIFKGEEAVAQPDYGEHFGQEVATLLAALTL